MRLLFVSDLHLPIGPEQPLRPELRTNLRFINPWGEKYADRLEKRLRIKAGVVQDKTETWLLDHDYLYDLIINGGDNAFPLNDHQNRMMASETVWTRELKRYGESRYLALTGNHELGHGYAASLKSYPDFKDLRRYLFNRRINQYGFGFENHHGCTILAIDSEILFLAQKYPRASLVVNDFQKMNYQIKLALREKNPLLILTHNTRRTKKYLLKNGFKKSLLDNNRQVFMVGGHFHVPRLIEKNGISEFWAGGASFPEPIVEWLENFPKTGIIPGGAGGVEINLKPNMILARHQSFNNSILFQNQNYNQAA